jgi:hypothetical protein
MANTVVVQKLIDGPRLAVFRVYLRGDGASGEIKNQVIIDPNADLVPPLGKGRRLSLVKVWYGAAGVDVALAFQDPAKVEQVPIWVIPAGTLSGHVNFNEFGGISDKSGIDALGKLILSTTGLMTINDQVSLIIKVSKHVDPYTNP